jgi:anti-sigma B factor antagonist
MKLNVQPSGDVAVVTVQVEFLDGGNAKAFKEQITPVCGQYHKVVLDLGQVQFVDSTGCGAILTCLKQLSAAKGDLKLCRVTRPVQALFDLVRIQRILECYATVEEAVKSFTPAAESNA